jgi:transcriptional regulator with XRE-family HTH domain
MEAPLSKSKRTYTNYTVEATDVLGKLIKFGRKRKRMTENDLAERLGIARSTLRRIESGNTRVEIGLFFEAAALTGVPLFDEEQGFVYRLSDRVNDKIALLPKHIYKVQEPVDDDF